MQVLSGMTHMQLPWPEFKFCIHMLPERLVVSVCWDRLYQMHGQAGFFGTCSTAFGCCCSSPVAYKPCALCIGSPPISPSTTPP
jgi:hypothetical protein